MLEVIPLYVTAVANFCLGLIVLVRAPKKVYSWFFMAAVLGAIMWGVGDALILATDDRAVLSVARLLFYVGPMAIPACMWFFALSFQDHRLGGLPTLFGITVFVGAAIAVISWPRGLISHIDIEPVRNVVHVNVTGFVIYAVYFLVMFTLSYVALLKLYSSNKDVLQRTQVVHVLLGLLLASVPALITNLGLPILGNSEFIWLGPIFSSAFVIAVTISIVKYRLFDIRLVIARVIGYGFSVALIAGVYGFLVFGSAQLLFGLHISGRVQIILSIITGIAGLVFHSMRGRFNRVTNTVLYRDAYDAEDLFNSLNTILVSSLNLEYLMRKTSGLLAERLKVSYVSIAVHDEGIVRVVGSEKHGIDRTVIEAIDGFTTLTRRGVISTDYLETSETRELKSLLEKHDIALLVPLSSRIKKKQESLGYIVLGPKRSGNFYTTQDSRVLETVANELILAIQNALHFEEIQRFNVTLQAKVDDATKKLRKTNHKLQELDETKDDFISMASHQLRTPLTSVKGYISLVLDGDTGKINEAQQKMLRQSYASSQRMVYLISDLLNVSRLKTGKFVVEPKPTSLPDLVQEEIGQLVETAKTRSIKLTYKAPTNFPKLMLDETKTRQVIMNFIDNALYYTPTGGHIEVSITEKSGTIELTVTDNGIGVPKTEQHHLFTKFYRAKNAQRARPDGTGLGLFMAKKVIVAQGGAVLFTSQEGKGSTFGFTFPKSKLKVPV